MDLGWNWTLSDENIKIVFLECYQNDYQKRGFYQRYIFDIKILGKHQQNSIIS